MKKIGSFLILSVMISTPAFADLDGRVSQGGFGRVGTVFSRGLANAVGLPAEVVTTPMREVETHAKAWPLTVIPRLAYNLVVRAVSAVNDVVAYPFIVPFTDDLSPVTEPFGLPEYPWQK